MKLPLLVSVPHAGLQVPPEVEDICILNDKDIVSDSDEGAAETYYGLAKYCHGFVASDIARALIDLNRAPDDIGGDGVIKSHTCWNIPVYRKFPDKKLMKVLLDRYYFPYHGNLSAGGKNPAIRLGIDCHTMLAVGPPLGPDPGRERPLVCVSNADGTCPQEWIKGLADCFAEVFKQRIAINSPFQGGYITRKHASEMFWLQIEISRSNLYSLKFKRDCLLEGLRRFCHTYIT
jgi:N-formylglutamate deformylase